MDTWRLHAQGLQHSPVQVCAWHMSLQRQGIRYGLRSGVSTVRQRLIGRQKADALHGQLESRKQGARIHVVLHQLVSHHHIPHAHALSYPTGHAGEPQLSGMKVLNQQRAGDGGRHLANARQHRHHLMPSPVADPECSPTNHLLGFVWHGIQKGLQLFRHGSQNADAAG